MSGRRGTGRARAAIVALLVGLAAFGASNSAQAQGGVQDLPPLPPANAAVEQQSRGDFDTMSRETAPGGAIQKAWTTAPAESGVYRPDWNPNRVVKVHLREGIISTISLPRSERIVERVLGDQTNFGEKPGALPYQLHVWVKYPGFDSNLNIISDSGTIYSVYLRGETWNSRNIADQVIEIGAPGPGFAARPLIPPPEAGAGQSGTGQGGAGPAGAQNGGQAGSDLLVEASLDSDSLAGGTGANSGEWLHRNPWTPEKVRLDREMRGDIEIAPLAVFRDDRFTYLDYGNLTGQPWPAAFAVVDRIDAPVNTRKSQDGRFLIVETIQPISLRHGEKVVCIVPTGSKAGTPKRADGEVAGPQVTGTSRVAQGDYALAQDWGR